MIRFILYFLVLTTLIKAQSFELIGPPGGNVLNMKIHPGNTDIVYTNTYNNGFFKIYHDIQVEIVKNYFGHNPPTNFFLSKNNPEYLYTGYPGYGTFISTNSGNNWNSITKGDVGSIYFSFNPLNSDKMLMLRNSKELWRSGDKGFNWHHLKTFEKDL